MDALSHALIAYILFSPAAPASLVPFAVIGAVLPDIDIVFSPVADRDPRLYLFAHGGIAHSIAGAVILALIAYGAIAGLVFSGLIPQVVLAGAGIAGLPYLVAGALLHVGIDTLACPGIPLLAPFSDRKYTVAVLPGPSILLAFAALGAVAVAATRLMPFTETFLLYGGTVAGYLVVRAAIFLVADAKFSGRKIPTFNPFRWLVVREDETAYYVRYCTFFSSPSKETVFEKFSGTDSREIAAAARSPEVQRFLFHAYGVTAERIGAVLILADPLREKGYLYYPPRYRRIAVPAGE